MNYIHLKYINLESRVFTYKISFNEKFYIQIKLVSEKTKNENTIKK